MYLVASRTVQDTTERTFDDNKLFRWPLQPTTLIHLAIHCTRQSHHTPSLLLSALRRLDHHSDGKCSVSLFSPRLSFFSIRTDKLIRLGHF
jgi:hypothetical protein